MWLIGMGQRDTTVFASQTAPAAATNAAQSSLWILSVSPSAPDSQVRNLAASKNSPAPKSPAPETGRSKVTVGPNTTPRSSRSVEPHARETSIMNSEIDPVELWKEVGNGGTSAEVALASLYFDGVVMPQNCLQAQVLLLAALKKGNNDAE